MTAICLLLCAQTLGPSDVPAKSQFCFFLEFMERRMGKGEREVFLCSLEGKIKSYY